jgi:hypothetical protein
LRLHLQDTPSLHFDLIHLNTESAFWFDGYTKPLVTFFGHFGFNFSFGFFMISNASTFSHQLAQDRVIEDTGRFVQEYTVHTDAQSDSHKSLRVVGELGNGKRLHVIMTGKLET